jgi:CTP:molybdopterin cytidylyltransferase MocA
MGLTAGIIVSLAGAPSAAVSYYQLALALAAFRQRDDGPFAEPRTRLTVIVPAHDEELLVGRCVSSLREQDYPRDLLDIVVVADNCGDATAARAREAGARVLVRNEPLERGKGHALRWAFDRLSRERVAPDAFVVVDADCVAAPGLLRRLVQRFENGAAAVQGESLLVDDGSPAAAFRAAAFLLINRVRPAGRAAIGRPVRLSGTGMLLGRALLQAHPWSAFSSTEDLEYSVALRVAGIGVAFARGAIVESPAAPNAAAAAEQQLRWEGGKLHFLRTRVPGLLAGAVRERRGDLLDEALELAVPPLGLFVLGTGAGAAVGAGLVATGAAPVWSLMPWFAALAGVPLYVLVGLRAGHAPASAYRALARSPLFFLAKLRHVRRFAAFRADTWVRTERAG